MNCETLSPAVRALIRCLRQTLPWLALVGSLATSAKAATGTEIGGYIKQNFVPGVSFFGLAFAEPPTQLVGQLLRDVPNQTRIVALRGGQPVTNVFHADLGWEDPLMMLRAFEGLRLELPPDSQGYSLTQVGSIAGQLNPAAIALLPGENWVGVPIPAATTLDRLCFPLADGLEVWTFDALGNRQKLAGVAGGTWVPAAPQVTVGAALIVHTPVPLVWAMAFTEGVNLGDACLDLTTADIRNLPGRILARPGDTVKLTPIVDGPRPLTYEWLRDGEPLTGRVPLGLSLTVTNELPVNWTLRVTDAAGHTVTADCQVETSTEPPTLRWLASAENRRLDFRGLTSRQHTLLVSDDLREWRVGQSALPVPVAFTPDDLATRYPGARFFQLREE